MTTPLSEPDSTPGSAGADPGGAPGSPPPPPPGYGAPPPGYGAPPPGYGAPPPGYGAPPPGYAGGGPLTPEDERLWGMLAHIGALVAGLVALAFLGPLIVMLTQGTKSPFVRRHAVESLNFQITLIIAFVVGSIAGVILAIITFGLALIILIPLALAIGIASLILIIVAGVKANNGEEYRYPFTLRLVK